MSAFKIVQNIPRVSGTSTSVPISLHSGYLRITPEQNAYIETGYNPVINTSTSLWVRSGDTVFLKEPVRSQTPQYILPAVNTLLYLSSGSSTAFEVGDFVSVSGISVVGLNTTYAEVVNISNQYNNEYFCCSIQLDWDTSSLNTSQLIQLDSSAEIRRAIKVAVNSTGITHITEVQVTNSI